LCHKGETLQLVAGSDSITIYAKHDKKNNNKRVREKEWKNQESW